MNQSYHPFQPTASTQQTQGPLPPFGQTTRHVGSEFPNQGLNPCPLHWKRRILTTGLPRKPTISHSKSLYWLL